MTESVTDMIGHNLPPGPPAPETIAEILRDENADLLRRKEELLAAAARAPEAIHDEDTARRMSDFIKQISAGVKSANDRRVGAKEPYLAGGRAVDGFFKALSDPLEAAKKTISGRLTIWLRAKEEEERRRRAEEERKAREAAEAARREAEERAAALVSDDELDAAIDAERAAAQAQADHIKAQKAAEAKAAELSRTRGDYGSVSGLRTQWTFDGLDRASLDLEALRDHLPLDGLEKAVRSYIRAGGRTLKGVRIFEDHVATVR